MLDSSGIFRNKRKIKSLCDQSNRITRYFPAKKCGAKTQTVPYRDKAYPAVANDLTKFAYNRLGSRSSTLVERKASVWAEDHQFFNDEKVQGGFFLGQNFSEMRAMSDSVNQDSANGIGHFMGYSAVTCAEASQGKRPLLGVSEQPAGRRSSLRKVFNMPCAGYLKLSGSTIGDAMKNDSSHAAHQINHPEICPKLVGHCSQKPSGVQKAHDSAHDAVHRQLRTGKRSIVESDRDISQNKRVVTTVPFFFDKHLNTPTERQNSRYLGSPCGSTWSADKAKLFLGQTPQEPTGTATPRAESAFCRKVICQTVSDFSVPPSSSPDSFREAGEFNDIGELTMPEKRYVPVQCHRDRPNGDLHGISTERVRSETANLFEEEICVSDTNDRASMRRDPHNGTHENYLVEGAGYEFLEGLEDSNTSGKMQEAEGGTRRWDWNRPEVQVTDDQQRVRQITEDSLLGMLFGDNGMASRRADGHDRGSTCNTDHA
ncbi:hypothetical protein MRX96_023801 [Rhipicephalus microplus]